MSLAMRHLATMHCHEAFCDEVVCHEVFYYEALCLKPFAAKHLAMRHFALRRGKGMLKAVGDGGAWQMLRGMTQFGSRITSNRRVGCLHFVHC